MDYCGFFMQNDLLHDLGRLMSPPVSLCRSEICGSGSSDFDCAANILPDGGFIPASDPLDDMRNDAHEEFLHNGVVVELDELDKYQSRLRERTSSEILTNEQNPVLLEYLRMRERRRDRKTKKVCVFCKNNGEPANVYQGHVLKDGQGRVSCPILRKYTCPLCGTSGDTAHTIRYCPLGDSDATACSTLALLKTNRLSTGKKRKC